MTENLHACEVVVNNGAIQNLEIFERLLSVKEFDLTKHNYLLGKGFWSLQLNVESVADLIGRTSCSLMECPLMVFDTSLTKPCQDPPKTTYILSDVFQNSRVVIWYKEGLKLCG